MEVEVEVDASVDGVLFFANLHADLSKLRNLGLNSQMRVELR